MIDWLILALRLVLAGLGEVRINTDNFKLLGGGLRYDLHGDSGGLTKVR
jgi:hypothetical protein